MEDLSDRLWLGSTAKDFYQTYRDSCSPPMVHLGAIDAGDLWFYDHFASSIVACVGARTLLVTYGPLWPREQTVTIFNEAHRRTVEDTPSHPEHVMFAARETDDGEVVIRYLESGDWAALIRHLPLPPPKRQIPKLWDHQK